ncbi:bacillithiol biosynthesis protein BshC [Metabacillus sp. SLBN-84]
MEITDLSLRHSNRLVEDLISGRLNTEDYFDYSITDDTVYEKRVKDLKNRTFAREELSSYLLSYHQKHFQDKEPVIRNIERLKDPESLVVVGGQQAGLLTGPLYTIHKIISILVLAEQQEAKLSVPVIPVFWVAG